MTESISQGIPMPVITQLQAVFQRDPSADSVALVWPEPLSVQQCVGTVDGLAVRFVHCVSELAIREALVNHVQASTKNSHEERLVLLSRFDEVHLAKDVLARLWKNEPQRISPWKTLQQLIRVREIDPRLTKRSGRWMAEALLGCFDRYQGKIAFGEVLDQELAWRALMLGYLSYEEPAVDLESLLDWSTQVDVAALVKGLPEDVLNNLGDWLAKDLPKTFELVTTMLKRGHGDALLPIGLTCSVLFDPELEQGSSLEASQLHMSRGLFRERYLGGQSFEQALFRQLGQTSTHWVRQCLVRKGYQSVGTALSQAEQILASLDLSSAARLSSILPCGFDGRLEELANAMEAVLSGENIDTAETMLAAVNQHALAALASKKETISRASMAVRLLRWLKSGSTTKGSAAELIQDYVEQGGFCDWARSVIWSGDVHDSLNRVYQRISAEVFKRRDSQNYAFSQHLSVIARGDALPDALIPVERTLERLVAPLAEQAPVLLLVLDGMSEAVYRKLAEDLARHHWLELQQEDQAEDFCLVAALPTVTQVSRCSLLSGILVEGNAADEKKAFASHGVLKKIASTKFPPKVFHKQDLSNDGSGSLNSSVRAMLAGTEHRILATVINAIDDQLSSSSQVSIDWSLDSIVLLRQVLEAAREAGRVVIITSDHGHVMDFNSIYQSSSAENGERYQAVGANVEPCELELKVSGERVVMKGSSVILPWTERLRYTKAKNQGYHGGATLQEVVIPLGVFINASTQVVPNGWLEIPRRLPLWWDASDVIVAETPGSYESSVSVATKQSKKSVKTKLFEAASEVMDDMFGEGADESPLKRTGADEPDWIDQVFESPVYKQVRDRAGRSAVKDEQLRSFLALVQRHQWQVMDAVVVRDLKIPKLRLRGFLAGVQKLLNVDGYRILSVDRESQTIKINIADLFKQFEISRPGVGDDH